MRDWYRSPVEDVVQTLQTDANHGLAVAEAGRRLDQYGLNELVERGTKPVLAILWDQIKEVMVVILIVSAIISLFLGEFNDAIVIMLIVVLNAALGVTQEYRAERAIAALKELAVPLVRVVREGKVQEISARKLVPGDLVLLEAGNKVPADGRLALSVNLRVEEASLTGESEPVEKTVAPIHSLGATLGDRTNMAYLGTVVTYGRGQMVVTETGMNTELGRIADMIQSVEREPTPLQRRLDRLGKNLAWVAGGIIALVVLLGLIRDGFTVENIRLLFLTGISMAVAAVPEGLPAVVTITLALGSQRMLRRHALIRKLPAAESLGSVTTICSDKTGTLTENRMTVTVLDVANEEPLQVETLMDDMGAVLDLDSDPNVSPPRRTLGVLVKAMALCNDATLTVDEDTGMQRAIGDPTEGALVVAAARLGLPKTELDAKWPRVAEIPFTSERKRMTTINKTFNGPGEVQPPWGDVPYVAFCKGAVDSLLEIATHVWAGDRALPLDQDNLRERVNESNARQAQLGQRVLGVAFRPLASLPDGEEMAEVESNMVLVGILGMLDPPRPEVKEAVQKCRTAGIRPVMITGDHPLTAMHIARKLDIARNGHHLTGQQLNHLSLEELEAQVEDVSVYARVSPEHKLSIVQALQDKGHIVAMTGDGINDAPALKKADIGVAMGITGTDVSKEAADMILLDDNFATIVAAVEEGRVIFDNIRKFIKYTLSSNTGELLVMLLAPFLGMPLPLVPAQILWINLVTDGLPGLALAVEPAERGIMKRPPFHPNESIFSRGMGVDIVWVGILMGLVSLAVGFAYWLQDPHGPWQTMVFTTLTLAQMGNALALRSNTDSLFTIGLFSNRAALGSVLLTFLLQLVVVYVAVFQRFFETVALGPRDLIIALLASTVVFWAVELRKWLKRWRSRQVASGL